MTEAPSPPAPAPAPKTEPFRRLSFDLKGGAMAGIAFGPEAPPDIVFLHATGFNARTYASVLSPLGERFPVLALDARGHGRTTLPPKLMGYTSWRRHRDDVIAVLEQKAAHPVTLAGHSMGAVVALLVAARRPDLVAGLALIEPVIMPAALYALFELPLSPFIQRHIFPLARGALRRRAHFASREEAAAGFVGRGVFKTFPREVIEDFVGDGLIEDEKRGGFKLACAPKFEAATYCAQRHDPWAAFRRVSQPMVMLRAEHHSTVQAATAHRLAMLKPEARIALVEGASHMLPMERPDRARAAIETAALMSGRNWRDAVE
ncbi:MAG: alpha/beta hydrolase [Terricaulis sp.]|nr:alpha/beta hydrolase [Terricaulis sp.]